MSDPRDELLDQIQVELLNMRIITHNVYEKYTRDERRAMVECQWAYAAGHCAAIAEKLLGEIEQLKRARSKTGSQ